MSNFDLRKYLAEGRLLKEEENLTEFFNLFRKKTNQEPTSPPSQQKPTSTPTPPKSINPEDVEGSEKIIDAKTATEFIKNNKKLSLQQQLNVVAKKLGIDPELFKVTSDSRNYGQPGEQQGFTETVSVNGEMIYSSSTTMSGEDAGRDDYSDKLEAIIQKQIK